MERELEARARAGAELPDGTKLPHGAQLPETSAAHSLNAAGLGARLRAERLGRGLSLEAVEAETQVRRRFLEAIEEGRWERLPGPVYARGFVKLYARAVGLDPAEVVQEFDAQMEDRLRRARGPARPDRAGPGPRGAGGATPGHRAAGKGSASVSASTWWSLPDPLLRALEPARRIRTASLLAILVVGAAVTGTWLLTRSLESPRPTLPSLGAMRPTAATPADVPPPQGDIAVSTPPAETPATTPPADTPASAPQGGEARAPVPQGGATPTPVSQGDTSQPSGATPVAPPLQGVAGPRQEREAAGGSPEGPVRLTARVRERSWMEVFADGQLVFSRSAEPGEVITWEARQVITVRFGRPEVVDLTLNGVELGRAGTGVITRVFTAETVRRPRPPAGREGEGRQGEAGGF